MKTLQVDLGTRSYPIYIGAGLSNEKGLIDRYIQGSEALVVTNETVAPIYLDKVLGQLDKPKLDVVVLPDGERFKNLETLNLIFDELLARGHSRGTTLIALGGGVVGDMTGYAAASYQRGVNFIQIPTTLLAQVDSSVGGKTGVNHRLGKNMIGAFYQPVLVVADVQTLVTLPDREYRAGIAEVVKYGLIADPEFYSWLLGHVQSINDRDQNTLIDIVERCCRNKADVVSRDERESSIRAILNLGHTFGHAIEAVEQYRGLLHGEAVAVGMLMAAELSSQLGWISHQDVSQLEGLLDALGLPTKAPGVMTPEKFLSAMALDKKVTDGVVRLVLLEAVGRAVVTGDYPQDKLQAVLDLYCN